MLAINDNQVKLKKRKTGRKSIRLSKSMIKDIQDMVSRGFYEKDVCKAIGVSHTLFYKWKGRNNDLVEAISAARRVALIDVEDKLRDMALGNTVITETISMKNSDGKTVSTVEKVKHPGPDFRAIQFSLANGLPEQYRDEGKGDISVTLVQAPLIAKTDKVGVAAQLPAKQIERVTGGSTAQGGKAKLSPGVKMLQAPAPHRTGPLKRKNAIVVKKKSPKRGGGGDE